MGAKHVELLKQARKLMVATRAECPDRGIFLCYAIAGVDLGIGYSLGAKLIDGRHPEFTQSDLSVEAWQIIHDITNNHLRKNAMTYCDGWEDERRLAWVDNVLIPQWESTKEN